VNVTEPLLADPGVADEADIERYLRPDRVRDEWDDAEREVMLDAAEMLGMPTSRQRHNGRRLRPGLGHSSLSSSSWSCAVLAGNPLANDLIVH